MAQHVFHKNRTLWVAGSAGESGAFHVEHATPRDSDDIDLEIESISRVYARVSKSWHANIKRGSWIIYQLLNPQARPPVLRHCSSSISCLTAMTSLLEEKDAAAPNDSAAELSEQGTAPYSAAIQVNGNGAKDAVAAGSIVGTTKDSSSFASAAAAAAADQTKPPTTGSNNKKKKKKKKVGKEGAAAVPVAAVAIAAATAATGKGGSGAGDGSGEGAATPVDKEDMRAEADGGRGAGGEVVHASSAGAAGGGSGGVEVGAAAAAATTAGASTASNGADILRLLKKQQIESLVARGGKKEHK